MAVRGRDSFAKWRPKQGEAQGIEPDRSSAAGGGVPLPQPLVGLKEFPSQPAPVQLDSEGLQFRGGKVQLASRLLWCALASHLFPSVRCEVQIARWRVEEDDDTKRSAGTRPPHRGSFQELE